LNVLKRYDIQHKTNNKKQIKYGGIVKMKDKIEQVEKICGKCKEIQAELDNVLHMQMSFASNKTDADVLLKKLDKIKAMIPEMCPTCGSVLWEM
jgi:hypothetical protein